jgi:hypothetical protein
MNAPMEETVLLETEQGEYEEEPLVQPLLLQQTQGMITCHE